MAPIPDIVERLRVYSREGADTPAADEPPTEPEVGKAELGESHGEDQPPARRSSTPSNRAPPPVGQTDGMSQVVEAPVEVEEPTGDDVPLDERPWVVIVWNDPINLMSYVTLVLQQLFGYSRARATKLMLQVHNEGKAAVSAGTREKAELDVSRLHAHGLWATMEQD